MTDIISLPFLVHYGMHFLIPLGLAWLIDKKRWLRIYGIFLIAMLIDLDHLLATPIFDPNRCSIGFHPLHSWIAIAGYATLMIPKKIRIVGLALCWHIITDLTDCLMNGTLRLPFPG